ncbi:hypothetical protein PILCRDRAFT_4223 [Piloderma croceum F 1598]|uniref:Uncharacterized protein n=1 Tax=Piloderma croceum (strain F 1598) TaxID=765440 RepID=A0A0C3FS83_PILCF|nr:hypothetical protein PILCRDRAFT_4223 [Piloderma croceum F 1598]
MPAPKTPVASPITFSFYNGEILLTSVIDCETKQHLVTCDLCSQVIKLGIRGSITPISQHRDSEKRKRRMFKASKLDSKSRNLAGEGSPDDLTMVNTSFISLLTNSVITETFPCPGVNVPWAPGSIWATYPYQLHATDSIGWKPVSFIEDTNSISIHADNCAGSSTNKKLPCRSCESLPQSLKFSDFIGQATEASKFTNCDYLDSQQLKALLEKLSDTCCELQKKLSNAKSHAAITGRKIADHKWILMLLSPNDIAGLHHLLATALRQGASALTICGILDCAISGLYSPQSGFIKHDLDIALLVKSIGGPCLLYSLQKSQGFASWKTVGCHHNIPRLLPSIGIPSADEISSNISSFFDLSAKPQPTSAQNGFLPGNIVTVDEIALETRCRYCPKHDSILGLCREHSHNVDTKVISLDSVEKVRVALFESQDDTTKVCFGSDATVVGIAPYAQDDHYSPVPIVASPSDKQEKGADLAKWLEIVFSTWKTHSLGEMVNGPIWALGTDGDASYRLAKQKICAMGIDHVNPRSWAGNVCVGGVNLKTEWKQGQVDAENILQKVYKKGVFNFDSAFSKPGHDLLRPLGEYVGVAATSDDARSEEDSVPFLIVEKASESMLLIQSDDSSEEQSEDAFNSTQEADEDDSPDVPLGMDFDDFLPDTAEGIDVSVEPKAFSKTLMVDGKEFLKSSIVASLSSNCSKKVTI